SGEVYVVTKEQAGMVSHVYKFPQPMRLGESVTLLDVTALTLPAQGDSALTGGDIHPCGDALLLRMYNRIVELRLAPDAGPFEKRGLGLVALSLQADEDAVMEAAGRAEVDSTLAIASGEAMGPLGLREIPATVFIDDHSTIIAAATGEHDAAALSRLAEETMK